MPQATPSARVDSSPILDGPTAPLRRALDWAFGTRLFDGLAAHGNTAWAFPEFVSLVLLWVWSERTTLAGAFAQAAQLARDWFGRSPLASYTGFAGALTRWTPELIPLLRRRLRTRMAQIGNAHYRIGGWVPIAVDGSRTTAPRTRANEAAFHPKKYGSGHRARSRKSWKSKKRRSKKLARPGRPQIWLTLLWHMGLKMPWSWKCGPSNSSERHHFAEALETEVFPERTLFCADAGFVGYDLWAAMADKGHRFLIRVGANVRLLRKLGDPKVRGDFVHFWPKGAAARDRPPMTLRLLRFQSGRGELFAVTNALSNRELGDARASELYRARWGVEVQFTGFDCLLPLHWSQ